MLEQTQENPTHKPIMRKVAVIIPTHNNLNGLKKSIESLYESTNYPQFRLIIIESESTDGTNEYLETLKSKPDIYIYHTKKEGSIKAVNFGIGLTSKYEDVYLTQDDVIHLKNDKFDWMYEMASYAALGNIGLITVKNGLGMSGPSYKDNLPWVGTWAMYIPRETINKVGIFDDNMKIGEDIDYAYRVRELGLTIGVLDHYVNHHQIRDSPHQNQSQEVIKEAAVYFKKKHNLT